MKEEKDMPVKRCQEASWEEGSANFMTNFHETPVNDVEFLDAFLKIFSPATISPGFFISFSSHRFT